MHTICHVCARLFMSSKVVLHRFPRNFPGAISHRNDLKCPMCQEYLHGISNMFAQRADGPVPSASATSCPSPIGHSCPYMPHLEAAECHQPFSMEELHAHLLSTHAQTCKCPNCHAWLHDVDGAKSMDQLIREHVSQCCNQIECAGCNRRGNLTSMYMHSVTGRDQTCDTPHKMHAEFAHQLTTIMADQSADIGRVATMMLRCILEFVDVPWTSTLVVKWFCKLHEFVHDDLSSRLSIATPQEYTELIMLCTASFAHKYHKRSDKFSELPFVYRLVCIYMLHLHTAEVANVDSVDTVEPTHLTTLLDLIPEPEMSPMITFQLPPQWSP